MKYSAEKLNFVQTLSCLVITAIITKYKQYFFERFDRIRYKTKVSNLYICQYLKVLQYTHQYFIQSKLCSSQLPLHSSDATAR